MRAQKFILPTHVFPSADRKKPRPQIQRKLPFMFTQPCIHPPFWTLHSSISLQRPPREGKCPGGQITGIFGFSVVRTSISTKEEHTKNEIIRLLENWCSKIACPV